MTLLTTQMPDRHPVVGHLVRRRLARTAQVLAAAAAAGLAAAAVWFHLDGGRWLDVRTPSMATAAPVGTLVLAHQVPYGQLRVGDVISFHPPGRPGVTFTHRIVAIAAAGISTRGDANGATDPWTLHPGDIVGRAELLVPAAGFALRAAPLLALGFGILYGVTRFGIRPRTRQQLRVIGGSVLFMVAARWLQPFANVAQIATTSSDGTTSVTLVSTGILPIRIAAARGGGTATPLDLVSGQVGTIALHGAPASGRYELVPTLHLGLVGWLIAGLLCLSPLLWTTIVGVPRWDDEYATGIDR